MSTRRASWGLAAAGLALGSASAAVAAAAKPPAVVARVGVVAAAKPGAAVALSFSRTSVPHGDHITSYAVDFGDRSRRATGKARPGTLHHTWAKPGRYVITTFVTDALHHSVKTSNHITITAAAAPTPTPRPTSSPTSSPTPTPAPSASPGTCAAGDLASMITGDRPTYSQGQQATITATVRNTSAQTCTVSVYPAATPVSDAAGTVIWHGDCGPDGAEYGESCPSRGVVRQVTLAPGDSTVVATDTWGLQHDGTATTKPGPVPAGTYTISCPRIPATSTVTVTG